MTSGSSSPRQSDGSKAASGLAQLASGNFPYPFSRTREMLAEFAPGMSPEIDLTLGEPRETKPDFILDEMKAAEALFSKYPPINGYAELRGAIAAWAERRYGAGVKLDADSEILPVNGSREGLFFAALPAVGRKALATGEQPAMLMCNPYYAAYIGAALATNAEPVYLNATPATGNLPDLDKLAGEEDLLRRAVAFYLCSPANPQGAAASADYIARALELARRHDFMLFLDECYSEIYSHAPPTGGLEVAVRTDRHFDNLVVFNSLSKRSNVPGMRSGFAAGDATFLKKLTGIRNLIGPQMPGPTQMASAAVWAEDTHTEANRLAYKEKFDVCDGVLGGKFGYRRPDGGFFLWLDVGHFGGGVDTTVTLWKRAGVKVLPGAFLAQTDRFGENPGENFIRVALVAEPATIRLALERIVSVLG
ncbi:MAG: aminotransferase class I/II-fold pyridoxal phosphate-dependent enzyme [Alphaproteobacteria bacterium]|nr:aminotransferase class I/II-fold pyridoxal phosphate-dependent enzyme [Alphaproteobacteria bacterium]